MRLRDCILALLLCAVPAASARAEEARITLLHTTDLHDALTSYDYLGDREYARGLTRIATMVKSARAEGRPLLLLDAGDCITGGPIGAAMLATHSTRPEPMMAAMSLMGYDAMAVGNHEFDLPPVALDAIRRTAKFPWLAANIVHAKDGSPAFGTSIVKELGGVRVGIIGLCTPAVPAWEDSANWAGLRFLSPLEAARTEAQRLRERERCDVIVILAHTGLEKDPGSDTDRLGDTPDENWGVRLATQVPDVDVVILGHTHTVVSFQRFGNVVATQAGKWGEQLGRVDLTLTRAAPTDRWQVRANARVIAVADTVKPDSALVEFARPYHNDTQQWLSQTVGSADRDLSAPRGRYENSALWELIHRAQLKASGADVSLASLFDTRVRFKKGAIRNRDLLALYGYDNTLVKVELTGAQLKQTLEQSAAYFQTYTYEHDRPLAAPGRPGFNFDAAAGVQYEIDLTRPPGDRIANLLYKGAPLDPGRRLTVAVNNYRANGGGGFDAIAHAPRLWRSEKTVRDLIADEVRAGPVGGGFDRNWRLLPDYVPTPERPLIDRLVRQGVAPAAELLRMESDEPARRGDLAYWLARAYGWRAKKPSGAFADVPDSLEPWLDGLLEHKALGSMGEGETIAPFAIAPLALSLDWCVGAARHAHGYDLASTANAESFRRSLITGLGFAHGPGGRLVFQRDTLTRAEVMALVSNTRYPTLRVLETTDFHGFILPGATDRRSGRAIGSSPVLAAWIEKLRGENPEGTLLLDGGDCFQGTMISNLQFGRPVVEQMNAIGYQAMAIGNHEFDWTADTLSRRVREMKFAALAANMIVKKTKKLPPWVRSDTLFVRRGVPVGVLGLAYRNTPTVTLAANVAHLRFEDDSATAARVAPALRKRGARVVFGVGHIPAESDSLRHARSGDLLRLARGVKGVDAWFGGHSHNQVIDEVNGVPLMIAGAHGEVVAVCDVVMDPPAGAPIEKRSRLQATYADEVTADTAMVSRVERWNANVAPIAAQELGRNARALTRNRNSESSLGNFVTDAMREASGAAIALQNSGGLRADLAEGVVTRGEIYEVMPFDNTVVTMELTGAEVRRVFEDGLRFGRVAQLSGVRITFDLDKPDFQRVQSLTLADGAPIDDAKTYVVAVNNFMATGGDNFDSLVKGRNITDTGVVIRNTLEDYIRKRTQRGEALDVNLDGRIKRVGGAGGSSDR